MLKIIIQYILTTLIFTCNSSFIVGAMNAEALRTSLLYDLKQESKETLFSLTNHPIAPTLCICLLTAAGFTNEITSIEQSGYVNPSHINLLRNHPATQEAIQRLTLLEGLPFNKAVESIAKIMEQIDMSSGKGLTLSYLGEASQPYHKKQRSNNVVSNVHPLILNRWSSLSLSSEPLPHETIITLVDAARWAPSSYNNQPWRFIYAHKKSKEWNKIFSTLQPRNQRWVEDAPVLFVLLSKKTLDRTGKPDTAHSFGAGSAYQNFILQASSMGLVARCMDRLNYDALRIALHIPHEYAIEVVIAVGKPGVQEQLPHDLQTRNRPSDRKPLEEVMFEGTFPTQFQSKL